MRICMSLDCLDLIKSHHSKDPPRPVLSLCFALLSTDAANTSMDILHSFYRSIHNIKKWKYVEATWHRVIPITGKWATSWYIKVKVGAPFLSLGITSLNTQANTSANLLYTKTNTRGIERRLHVDPRHLNYCGRWI